MRTVRLLLSIAVLTCFPLFAQRIWVVDAVGGAGSQFRTITQAIAAARDGDRIVVRRGTYAAFSTSKALQILAEQGAIVEITNSLSTAGFSSIGAGKTAALRGFTFRTKNVVSRYAAALTVQNCQGRIVLANLRFERTSALHALHVTGSPAVTIENSDVQRPLRVTDSLLVGVNTTFYGGSAGPPVAVVRGTVQLVACQAHGGVGGHGVPMSGIDALNAWIELRGAGSSYSGAASLLGQAPSVQGDYKSTLTYDPIIRFRAPVQQSFGVVNVRQMPWLTTGGGQIGGKVDLRFGSQIGHAYMGFVGLPMAPQTIPSVGELWIEPRLHFVVAQGVLGSSGVMSVTHPVPSAPSLLGLAVTYQFLSGTVNRVELSNGSTVLVYR